MLPKIITQYFTVKCYSYLSGFVNRFSSLGKFMNELSFMWDEQPDFFSFYFLAEPKEDFESMKYCNIALKHK